MQTIFAKALVLATLTVALIALSGQNAMAQDGKALFVKFGCMACHGQDGKVPVLPNYPRLAGQNSDYMAQQLRDFKTQKRTNNLAPLMFGMTNPLSEADIKAISDYLAAVN